MTDKKHKQHKPEEVTETPVEATSERPQVDVAELMKKLEEAEAKVAEHRDGWQRAQAEFVNYKNRIQRDAESQRANMKGDILQKLLPVLDDLELALQNRPVDNAWAGGIELIARKFQSALESEGVKRIEAEGQPFDPNFHEAISHEPNDEFESGHVIAVVRNGYTLGERVIRPAMVRVAQ
ncbi:MAG: nucleotide exchange factor GrpE [Anaerolineaceae bacterium]|nr:MAG: nucleotide exchange factor GrpE [Anaerolineaceae bacterium]